MTPERLAEITTKIKDGMRYSQRQYVDELQAEIERLQAAIVSRKKEEEAWKIEIERLYTESRGTSFTLKPNASESPAD